MDSIIPVEIRTAIANAEKALAALKEDFALVEREAATVNDAAASSSSTAPLDTAIAALDEVDTAKCRVAASFALASLYYINMKCGGLEPRTHDVMKELARVHLYIKKFQTRPQPTAEKTKPKENKGKGKGKDSSTATTAPAASSRGGKRTRGSRGHGNRH